MIRGCILANSAVAIKYKRGGRERGEEIANRHLKFDRYMPPAAIRHRHSNIILPPLITQHYQCYIKYTLPSACNNIMHKSM